MLSQIGIFGVCRVALGLFVVFLSVVAGHIFRSVLDL